MWTFGTNELISLIAALATFSAVIVSLYLALKSKTVKFKIFIKNNAQIIVINTGDAKFTINGFGIKVGSDYYMSRQQRFSKILSQSRQIKHSNNITTNTRQEISLGTSVLEPGDFVESGISNFNFDLCNEKSRLFVVINCKVHHYKFDFLKGDDQKNEKNELKKYTMEQVRYSGIFTDMK